MKQKKQTSSKKSIKKSMRYIFKLPTNNQSKYQLLTAKYSRTRYFLDKTTQYHTPSCLAAMGPMPVVYWSTDFQPLTSHHLLTRIKNTSAKQLDKRYVISDKRGQFLQKAGSMHSYQLQLDTYQTFGNSKQIPATKGGYINGVIYILQLKPTHKIVESPRAGSEHKGVWLQMLGDAHEYHV